MLCVAKVSLADWPEGQRRDVDPSNERIIGLLRAGYIVGLQLPRRPAAEEGFGPDTPLTPDGLPEKKPRGKRARTEDE